MHTILPLLFVSVTFICVVMVIYFNIIDYIERHRNQRGR